MNREDREALTRVGAGTPMGELLRRYWIPAALSVELEAAGPIVRRSLLGEALVLARDPQGAVTALAAACPHRGASLHLGRNEAGGLRCAYHGWKFDREGRCVDMPNEPEEHRFGEKVRAKAYSCRERGGVIWLYMGSGPAPLELPDLEWNMATRSRPFLWASSRNCNWVQAMEGDLDSSHLGVLHARWDDVDAPTVPGVKMPGPWSDGIRLVRGLGPPYLEVVETDYGALYSARRPRDDGTDYHRVHPFLFPFYTMLGGGIEPGQVAFNGKCWIPSDDTHTWMLDWHYRPDEPWSDAELTALREARYPYAGQVEPGPERDYGRDRALEVERMYFGVLSNPLQDRAVEESMGPISDRAREHLGPADAMIIQVRKRLLTAARQLQERGIAPPASASPELYRVRPVGVILPRGADWLQATRARRELRSADP
jgi:phthalate 4,5-dioxygenase